MVGLCRGKSQDGFNVIFFQKRVIVEYFLFRSASAKQFQYVFYPHAFTADTRPASAFAGFNGYTISIIHKLTIGALFGYEPRPSAIRSLFQSWMAHGTHPCKPSGSRLDIRQLLSHIQKQKLGKQKAANSKAEIWKAESRNRNWFLVLRSWFFAIFAIFRG